MGKTEELKRLENDLNSEKELREKFDAESLRIAKENSGADVESLDLEEMEKVSGGASCWSDYSCVALYRTDNEDEKGHDGWCLTAWHCNTALLHSDTDSKNVSCWKDFRCINISYHEVTPKPQYNTEG